MIEVGDKVVTRKPHACGGDEWTVTRTGADIKLSCNKCGHVVMLSPDKAKRAIKAVKRTEE